jgi:hypothetical protein
MSVRVNAPLTHGQRNQVRQPTADRHPAGSSHGAQDGRREATQIFYTGSRKSTQTRVATSRVHGPEPFGQSVHKVRRMCRVIERGAHHYG